MSAGPLILQHRGRGGEGMTITTTRRGLLAGSAAAPFLASPIKADTILTVGTSAQPAPDEWNALVVGINGYENARPLKTAINDAKAVGERLETAGYSVSLLEDPNQSELELGIDKVAARIRPESNFLLYFAGHGFQAGGTNFLMARDSGATGGQAMVDSSINLLSRLQRIANRKPRQCVVVLDACRNDPFGVEVPQVSANLASVIAPLGFTILYSAGSGQFALDTLGPQDDSANGVFVRALLGNLRPGIPLREMMYSTRRRVIELAASVGHSQHPAIYDQSTGEYRLGVAPVITTPSGEPAQVPVVVEPRQLAQPADRDTAFLVIGQDYDTMPGYQLRNPRNDSEMLARLFERSEIDGHLTMNGSDFEILGAAARVARTDASTIILYYSGYATLDPDGEFLLVWDGGDGIARINVEQLLSRMARKDRKIICFFDTMFYLSGDWTGADGEPVGDAPQLWRRLKPSDGPGPRSAADYPLAIFTATEIGGIALDGIKEQAHSPFANAIANTVGREDLSVDGIADAIATEVYQATAAVYDPQVTHFWSNYDTAQDRMWVDF